MKKLLLTIFIFGLISCAEDTFETVNLDKLLGKSVEDFMEHKLFKKFNEHYYYYTYDYTYKEGKDMAGLYGVYFTYNDEIIVSLYLDSLKYTNLFGTWYFEDVKKETIQGIEITKELPLKTIPIQRAWQQDKQ